MTDDKKNEAGSGAQTGDDSNEKLQEELARESKEGRDSIGDVGSNRTVSGSSSWDTLTDNAEPSSPRKNKDSA
jgi:hypothetical protein